MTLIAKNEYIIGKAYKINAENNAIVVNNRDTNCLIKVVSSFNYEWGDILLVDKNHTESYTIAGEEYIAVKNDYVIAQVQE